MDSRVPGLPGDSVVCYDTRPKRGVDNVVTLTRYGEIHYGPTGRGDCRNGVFMTTAYAYVAGTDQIEHLVPVTNLTPLPTAEWKTLKPKRLRDLPETKFWEDDLVTTTDGRIAKICTVRYHLLEIEPEGFPPYVLINGEQPLLDTEGEPEEFSTSDLTLVERGNVYKFFNNEPCTFSSVEDEAHFHYRLGFVTHIANPASGHHGFSHAQALAGLAAGEFDIVFPDSCYPMDGIHTYWCYRIVDREVGERARQVNLAGIALADRQLGI